VRHGRVLPVAAIVAAVISLPAAAHANGDPPSDVLLAQDAYFPYTPATSTGVAKAVLEITRRTRKDGWPIKVAIVATPNDLGTFADTINDPQRYAGILASEIGRPRLLVVMPAGYGSWRLRAKAEQVLAELQPVGEAGDPLALKALEAVAKLAAASGHPVRIPKVDRSAVGRRPYIGTVTLHPSGGAAPAARRRTKEGGASALLVFGGPVALIVAALIVVTVRERRRGD
jgi:hypothetical protein